MSRKYAARITPRRRRRRWSLGDDLAARWVAPASAAGAIDRDVAVLSNYTGSS